KSEIRNPKSETNSNEQRSKSAKPSRRGRANWSGFENLSFEFGACFGFRVSDFGFVLAGQRCPAEKMWDIRLRGEGERGARPWGRGHKILRSSLALGDNLVSAAAGRAAPKSYLSLQRQIAFFVKCFRAWKRHFVLR